MCVVSKLICFTESYIFDKADGETSVGKNTATDFLSIVITMGFSASQNTCPKSTLQ